MSIVEFLVLFAAGLTSGVMNSVAGGGSFVSFPVLVFFGLAPISANATSTMALVPGTFATMAAYRNELKIHNKKLPLYIFLSLVGGFVGSLLLLYISNEKFSEIVPYLILTATSLFTFKTSINQSIKKISRSADHINSPIYQALMLFLFIIVAIYGGFFGAGMGIIMLAVFSLMGMSNLNEMNALRSCCGLCANLIAVITFSFAKIIHWPEAIIMSAGAIIGGYFGAHYAKKLPNEKIRNIVIILGCIITIYFFYKEY